MFISKNPNAFANGDLDRAGHLRRDTDWLARNLRAEQSKRIALKNGEALVFEETGAPAYLDAAHVREGGDPGWTFLGLAPDGMACFALDAADWESAPAGMMFRNMWAAAAGGLDNRDLAMFGCAKALFDWHQRHGFCARCGQRSEPQEAGWKRVCPACKAEHFPRVDPVVIMLPVLGEKCLLARQASWPPRRVSALAGFMEPGETIEEAVARETLEEVGLKVDEVRLHSSQPWPFPSSLMLGAICTVSDEVVRIDPNEIEAAHWFSRDEAGRLLAGTLEDFASPPPFAIAHQLLKAWVAGW